MNTEFKIPGESISLFVKSIMVFEETGNPEKSVLPFFADGYPGLAFHISPNGLWVQPQNKKMPVTFLYGQTLHPTELHIQGSYKLIVFQLYPFVINSFFGVDARELNDSCYDLQQVNGWHTFESELLKNTAIDLQIDIITQFLIQQFEKQRTNLDFKIKESLQLIIDRKAAITVAELAGILHLSVRTFERRFVKQVGLSPKNFIQVIRFQQSMEQLSAKDFSKITDVVYENGYADHSHFIRVFKAFTGKTPSLFLKQ